MPRRLLAVVHGPPMDDCVEAAGPCPGRALPNRRTSSAAHPTGDENKAFFGTARGETPVGCVGSAVGPDARRESGGDAGSHASRAQQRRRPHAAPTPWGAGVCDRWLRWASCTMAKHRVRRPRLASDRRSPRAAPRGFHHGLPEEGFEVVGVARIAPPPAGPVSPGAPRIDYRSCTQAPGFATVAPPRTRSGARYSCRPVT
jgi:hypothetical protein